MELVTEPHYSVPGFIYGLTTKKKVSENMVLTIFRKLTAIIVDIFQLDILKS